MSGSQRCGSRMRNARWTAQGEMRGKGGEMGRGPSRRVSKTLTKPSRSMMVGAKDLKQAKSHDGGGVVCKRPQELSRMVR